MFENMVPKIFIIFVVLLFAVTVERTDSTPISVRPTDIDQKGHVNNAKYLEYLQCGRWDWLESHGLSNDELEEKENTTLVVVNVNINYKRAIKYGEIVNVKTVGVKKSDKVIIFQQIIIGENDKVIYADATVTTVVIDMITKKSRAMPSILNQLFLNKEEKKKKEKISKMTRHNYTHLVVVLDRSGSMTSCREATISGFNEFVNKQRLVDGECTLTLVQFDDQYDKLYGFKQLRDVPSLNLETFVPRGMTALYGAIGKTIDEEGQRLASLPESLRPSKVIVLIITDGGENSTPHSLWGREYTKEVLKYKIEHQQSRYNWDFVYLGANQDVILTAGNIGIAAASSSGFNSNDVGTKAVYNVMSAKIGSYRSSGLKSDLTFNASDRQTLAESK